MAIFNGWRITRTGVLFVLGIILLAGLVFGGIWLARERAEQARRDEAIKLAEQNLEEMAEQTPEQTTVDGEADNTEEEVVVVETPEPNATESLPETGPNDLAGLLAVAMLALATALYLSSRRAVRGR
jgi:LPXTG-motif cell wall-anchored protein